MPIFTRRCTACAREYDVLAWGFDKKVQDFTKLSALDREPEDDLRCPSCDEAGFVALVPRVAEGQAMQPSAGGTMYPYFDRGLGCEVRSAQHRRWLMIHHPDGTPRESRLYATEGAYDSLAELDRRRNANEDLDRRLKAQREEEDADGELRRAKDIVKQIQSEGRMGELLERGRL